MVELEKGYTVHTSNKNSINKKKIDLVNKTNLFLFIQNFVNINMIAFIESKAKHIVQRKATLSYTIA